MFDDVTVDWCVTCKFNKIMALNNTRTREIWQKKSIIAMGVDFTFQDDEIYLFLIYYNSVGISF